MEVRLPFTCILHIQRYPFSGNALDSALSLMHRRSQRRSYLVGLGVKSRHQLAVVVHGELINDDAIIQIFNVHGVIIKRLCRPAGLNIDLSTTVWSKT